MHLIRSILLSLTFATVALAQPNSVWSRRFAMEGVDLHHHQAFAKDRQTGNLVFIRAISGPHATLTNYLTCVDPDGKIVSNSLVPGDQRMYDIQSLIQSDDGDFVMVGGSPQDESIMCEILLLRMDLNGNLNSMDIFENPNSDHGLTVTQTADGGFGLGGYFGVVDNIGYDADFWLIRADSEGEPVYSSTFGEREIYEQCRGICETSDGGLLGVGNSGDKAYVIRTDSDGNLVWSTLIGIYRMRDIWSVINSTHNSYVVAGSIEESNAPVDTLRPRHYYDGWVVNLNDDGEIIWEYEAGGTLDDGFNSIIESRDGAYVMSGYTYSDSDRVCSYWLCKISSEGEPVWQKSYFNNGHKSANAVLQLDNGGFALIGNTEFNREASCSVLLLATEPDDDGAGEANSDKRIEFATYAILEKPYPNPFNAFTSIKYSLLEAGEIRLAVFNPSGSEVVELFSGIQSVGEHIIQWTPNDICSGVYFIRLETGIRSSTEKVLLIR